MTQQDAAESIGLDVEELITTRCLYGHKLEASLHALELGAAWDWFTRATRRGGAARVKTQVVGGPLNTADYAFDHYGN